MTIDLTAYEERWQWWIAEVLSLTDGHLDMPHARAAFDATGSDPLKAQLTPAEYAAEGHFR